MPWKKTTPMTERLSFIELDQTRLWSMTELCTRFEISRQTGDKWLRRYSPEGLSGLQEKSRAPLSCPHRIAPEVAIALLEAKPLHPGAPALHAASPNEVWTADFTGPCRTGDGGYGDPLTVADAYSRYRLSG